MHSLTKIVPIHQLKRLNCQKFGLLKKISVLKRWCSSRNVIVEKLDSSNGSVSLIAINRPQKKNCVNPDTAKELKEAVENMENDDSVRAAVLYGKGGTFCSGYDLSTVTEDDVKQITREQLNNGLMGLTRRTPCKPIIAAISGYAVAGGLELALWCDLRVMEESAIMGVFCRRFGVPLLDGGTVRLVAAAGLSRAMDLILTGREIRAEEALNIGLVNRVCDTGTAVGRAVMLAQEISKFPQKCLLADRKSAINAAYSMSLQQLLDYELENGLKIIQEESIPGASKFVKEKIGRHGSFNLKKAAKEKS